MPKLVMSVLGLVVVVLGLFLLADRLDGRLLGNTALTDASPVASPQPRECRGAANPARCRRGLHPPLERG